MSEWIVKRAERKRPVKVVVHLSGKFTPMSDEIDADQVSWTTETVTIEMGKLLIYYPREKVVKVEVIR